MELGRECFKLWGSTASSSAGNFGRNNMLFEEIPDGHTLTDYAWDVLPPDQGMVKEYYKVKDSNKDQFAGNKMNYHVWRQRFIATVHYHWMLISDKGLKESKLSMRDSATSAMRGWEHWKPDGFASELFLDQLILLES
jgi:hypothetical protein